jgi:hypothetical protein
MFFKSLPRCMRQHSCCLGFKSSGVTYLLDPSISLSTPSFRDVLSSDNPVTLNQFDRLIVAAIFQKFFLYCCCLCHPTFKLIHDLHCSKPSTEKHSFQLCFKAGCIHDIAADFHVKFVVLSETCSAA